MSLSSLIGRRPRRRATKDRSIALVVGLMMALVFVPVLGLHVAASLGAAPGLTAAAPASVDLAAQRKGQPGRG